MKRVIYYDILNILACFGVIAIHCNSIVNDYTGIPLADWLQTLVVSIVFMAAVPIFFMLSGATLLAYGKRMSTREFMRRRFFRAVLPFLAWSAVALIVAIVSGYRPQSPGELINAILHSQFMPPYWFFWPLFAVYLAMPVLTRLADDRQALKYLAAVGFVTVFLLPPLLRLVGINWNDLFNFPLAGGGYLVYAIVGYLLATTDISRWRRGLIYIFGFGSIVVAFLGTVWLTLASGTPDHSFWEYLYWPSLLFSSAVFLLFRQIGWQRLFGSQRAQRVLARVASASLGIYLIHVYGIGAFGHLTGLNDYDLLFRLVAPLAVYLVGLLIVLLLKRLPGIRHLLP